MNRVPGHLAGSRPIDIGAEPDFSLGVLSVHPSVREVRVGSRRETVEPRVMQVLVALARAEGAVVSRDRLIEHCWGGRLVGDDAINSCVAKVRALAALTTPPAFEIETVPRVGYRLHARSAIAREPPSPTADRSVSFAPRFMLVALIVAAFVAAIAMAFIFAPGPAKEWEVVESHQPFISTPDIERFPSFSPDGTMIAYWRGKNDASTRQIFLQFRNGGDPIQLTHDTLSAIAPAFSPDGTSVAYVAIADKQPCRIMLAEVPSGPSREIGHCRFAEASNLSWDRGGHALFYQDQSAPNQFLHIVRYDIETGTVKEITHPGENGSFLDFQPSASPDGKSILFMRYMEGDRLQVVLRDLKNGSEHVLADDDADKYAAWSDDSSTVFVTSNKNSDSSLWAYPVSGAAPWRITSNARTMEFLSSGPDGLLAVELKNKTTELTTAGATAGAPAHAIDTGGMQGCSFDYARDGTLALIAHNGEAPIVAVGAPGHLHQISRITGPSPCGIRWSPDGTKLGFASAEDSDYRISIVDREGMPVAQLPFPSRDIGYFEWTGDGKAILQSRLDAVGWRLWRVDVAPPFKAAPVLPYGWDFVHGHNGMLFGVKAGTPGVWRIDGAPKKLTDLPPAEHFWEWSVVDDGLVYADHSAIMLQPIAGGAPKIIAYANDMDTNSLLAIDPVDRQIAYNRVVRNDPDIGWLRLTRR